MPNWKGYFAAKAAMPAPVKDTKGYGYQYATLAQVKSIVDPACEANGIGYVQYQGLGYLHTVVADAETGETMIEDRRELGGETDQQRGSSETYQRRYALLTVFGLAPEDDDGASASKDKPAQQQPAQLSELDAAKQRLWAALKAYAAKHNTEPDKLLEGVKKRSNYAETDAFFESVAVEFESAD